MKVFRDKNKDMTFDMDPSPINGEFLESIYTDQIHLPNLHNVEFVYKSGLFERLDGGEKPGYYERIRKIQK